MKKFILILFCLWVVCAQTPLASRCEAGGTSGNACACCSGCDGDCGCVASGSPDQRPLPLAVTSTFPQTELLFPAAPAFLLALPFADLDEPIARSRTGGTFSAVPLFCRDCALLL